jgi:hypothetical protein
MQYKIPNLACILEPPIEFPLLEDHLRYPLRVTHLPVFPEHLLQRYHVAFVQDSLSRHLTFFYEKFRKFNGDLKEILVK